MKAPLRCSYDRDTDVVTINGIEFAGDFFRHFERPDPQALYKIDSDRHGQLAIFECFARPQAPPPVSKRDRLRCNCRLIPNDSRPSVRCLKEPGHEGGCLFWNVA